MSALETILTPAARMLTRNIRENTRARESCRALAGRTAAIRIDNTAFSAYFLFSDDSVELTTDEQEDPDLLISGSALSLAQLAGSGSGDAIRYGSIKLSGDVETAREFQTLLRYARPDLEEELSGVIGDAAAHQVGRAAKSFASWARGARRTMGENIREYLQEESHDVPRREEVDQFAASVSTLRDDVERLLARADKILGDR